jgi:hypothetical protein
MHRFTIDCNLSTSWLHIYDGSCALTLACTPRSTIFIDLISSFFFGEHSSKVKEINSVKLCEVTCVHIAFSSSKVDDVIVGLFGELR